MIELDELNRKILKALQEDGRLTNNELAELVNLSASQCSRRRSSLEREGCIRGYHAHLDKQAAGVALTSMVSITLSTHNADNAMHFAELIATLPNVLEAHALTGEMDYLLKVVSSDLKSLSTFINSILLQHESIANVKTAIVLETIKETSALPLYMEVV